MSRREKQQSKEKKDMSRLIIVIEVSSTKYKRRQNGERQRF